MLSLLKLAPASGACAVGVPEPIPSCDLQSTIHNLRTCYHHHPPSSCSAYPSDYMQRRTCCAHAAARSPRSLPEGQDLCGASVRNMKRNINIENGPRM
ncbi:hypothetical protein K438DRAFT_1836785, partial [Mycena galopus ATCC 62051]